MKRIAFYYNHYNTLGHSTRVFCLVKAIKEHCKGKTDIIVFQGGKLQDLLPFKKYAKVYLLPYSIDKKGLFIEEAVKIYDKMISHGGMEHMLQKRVLLINGVLNDFKPNLFITEYFPFGQEFWTFELPYVLRHIKNNFNCRIVASCGYLTWVKNTYEYIKEFYDALLIHSPKFFSTGYKSYFHKEASAGLDKIIKDFSKKIFFTGFILDDVKIASRKNIKDLFKIPPNKKIVLVSRGGGIVNKKIIVSSILAAKRNKNIFFIICCGPATSQKEFKAYKEMSKHMDNLILVRFLYPEHFNALLDISDLSVNMAGYNTTVKLLHAGKRTILIPYYTSEQRWRAESASRYLPARIINGNKLNIPFLEKNMFELLDGEDMLNNRMEKDCFLGASKTINILKCLA